jgi:hypothetical protein
MESWSEFSRASAPTLDAVAALKRAKPFYNIDIFNVARGSGCWQYPHWHNLI